MKNLNVILFLIPVILFVVGCDGSGDNSPNEPSGTLTATVGATAYTAATLGILTNNGFTITTRNSDGIRLDLTFLEVNATGQYPLINRAITPGPGVAGGYYTSGETYNIDSGLVSVTSYSSSRIAGTFTGTARGLLGAQNLPVMGGVFDIRY